LAIFVELKNMRLCQFIGSSFGKRCVKCRSILNKLHSFDLSVYENTLI